MDQVNNLRAWTGNRQIFVSIIYQQNMHSLKKTETFLKYLKITAISNVPVFGLWVFVSIFSSLSSDLTFSSFFLCIWSKNPRPPVCLCIQLSCRTTRNHFVCSEVSWETKCTSANKGIWIITIKGVRFKWPTTQWGRSKLHHFLNRKTKLRGKWEESFFMWKSNFDSYFLGGYWYKTSRSHVLIRISYAAYNQFLFNVLIFDFGCRNIPQ